MEECRKERASFPSAPCMLWDMGTEWRRFVCSKVGIRLGRILVDGSTASVNGSIRWIREPLKGNVWIEICKLSICIDTVPGSILRVQTAIPPPQHLYPEDLKISVSGSPKILIFKQIYDCISIYDVCFALKMFPTVFPCVVALPPRCSGLMKVKKERHSPRRRFHPLSRLAIWYLWFVLIT